MTTIGFMPLLRKGSTLFTAVVIHHRMFQSLGGPASVGAIYGRHKKHISNVLGAGAGEVARSLFNYSISPHQVLEQHTLFGAYSRTMAPHVAETLANQLIAGDSSRFRWAFRGHRRRQIPRLTTCLRSCEKCIEEDIDLQGFASWRVLHLLPSIGHCPEHGKPLRDEGEESTDGIRRWSLQLPGERTSSLTTLKAMNLSVSDGYAAYLQLWSEAFEGNLTGIAPGTWMLVMDAVAQHFGSAGRACEQLTSTIEKTWDAKLPNIARSLRITDGELFVQAELEQRVQASYVASRLVICGALDALGLSPPRLQNSPWQSQLELLPMAPFGSWFTPQTQAELARLVVHANFPPALFRGLSDDLDVYTLADRIKIDRIIIKRFVRTLPDELLYKMSKEQSWDRSSWLMKELSRRESAWSRSVQ